MNHLINFVKIQAAGNDFVVFQAEDLAENDLVPANIRRICSRQFGIGSDGVIVISEIQPGMPGMRYYNSDGTEGEMCGNGLRAAVLSAYIKGLIKPNVWTEFAAADGIHLVKYQSSDEILVEIRATGKPEKVELPVPANLYIWGFINTGVPHLVLNVNEGLDETPVTELGREFRYHDYFGDQGTNVNFVHVIERNKIRVRTYERGVEAETLSCGTGVTASALLYLNKFGNGMRDVTVETRGGLLSVIHSDNKVFLSGPAKITFTGQYLIENSQSEMNIKK